MGVADPYEEDRLRTVPMPEYVQHLLRYRTGHFVHGRRGHRVIWALVNGELLREAAGKGYAVHTNLMKRLRGRVVGGAVMTKGQLRAVLEDEDALRSMMNQLQVMGRDVRSTPMQWAFEGKKLDAAVKHLSWRPPWVRPVQGQEERDVDEAFMEERYRVDDDLGLGRIPSFWWTMNCRYNYAYDVQRLNVSAEYARDALLSTLDEHSYVRFGFTRDCPDIVAFMLALRTELNMRVVMPTVVPHSKEQPLLSMARMETGTTTGHPHYHGFSVGSGNFGFRRVKRDVEEKGPERLDGTPEDESSDAGTEDSVGASLKESDAENGGSADAEMCRPCDPAAREGAASSSRRKPVKGGPEPELPENLSERAQDRESQRELERRFWDCFGDFFLDIFLDVFFHFYK